ncbi:hypothetical protein [Streptomyces sp. CL12-4]|uniref:hypothetical protein n=1 Tax=Streptomyces sp. CL12-4 TaxID=2810306 RepID=UPI001EFBAE85|nr:hypothetical protein [Streptomyces sp. CL12-4]MCG8971805.1 hypothetical protein [Streptomyces sp. CL12-4]
MTASKPRRTMLPPNMTRHLYETQRLLAADEGRELPPWFALTPQQRNAAEMDMEAFRRAIIRAEEEQDLVASVNAPPEAPSLVGAAAEGCPCPRCVFEAALLKLLERALRREEPRQEATGTPNAFPFNVAEVTETSSGRTPSDEDRLQAREDIIQWFTDLETAGRAADPDLPDVVVWALEIGKPLAADNVTVYNIGDFGAPEQRLFDAIRWQSREPRLPKV